MSTDGVIDIRVTVTEEDLNGAGRSTGLIVVPPGLGDDLLKANPWGVVFLRKQWISDLGEHWYVLKLFRQKG